MDEVQQLLKTLKTGDVWLKVIIISLNASRADERNMCSIYNPIGNESAIKYCETHLKDSFIENKWTLARVLVFSNFFYFMNCNLTHYYMK